MTKSYFPSFGRVEPYLFGRLSPFGRRGVRAHTREAESQNGEMRCFHAYEILYDKDGNKIGVEVIDPRTVKT